ncbi:MAG: TonB-dependent receptor [Tannerellaceae bacterium]|nr:TonB-dependent receptor [Tannerellaceae bacterium]
MNYFLPKVWTPPCSKHLIRKMKASILFLMLGICTVSAGHLSSQESRLSLHLSDLSIRQIINEIEKSSEYVFVLSDNVEKEIERKISLQSSEEELNDILDKMFEGTRLTYKILDKQVVIYRDQNKKVASIDRPATLPATRQATKKKVTGVVSDKEGEPVIGASVLVTGTIIGTVTDFDGNFSLEVPDNATLQISYIGYKTIEVNPQGKEIVIVTLEENTELLGDVIVIGYGRVKKSDATGSVLAIKPDDINKGNQVTAQQALQGKAAGVLVTSKGGQPGEGATIRIRGGSSLSASNDPLIVIDGIAIDNSEIRGAGNVLGSLNPNDIESFTILKDASSTAIYGSRASNGVIIITTKKGALGSKRPSVNYSNNFSVSYNPKYMDVLTADEFRSFMHDEYRDKYGEDTSIIDELGTASTNWQKEIFRTAFSHEHNLSVTGATDFLPYRVSLGYTHQEGIIKKNNYERFTAGVALTPQFFSNHLSLNVNLKGSHENNDFVESPIGSAIGFDPTRPVYSDESEYGSGYFIWRDKAGQPIGTAATNPVAMLELRDDNSKVNRLFGNLQGDYKIHGWEDMRLNVNYGFDILESKGHIHIPDNSPQSWTAYSTDGTGINRDYIQKKKNTQLDMYANYVKETGIHTFDVMGGYSWQHFWQSYDNKQFDLTGGKVYDDYVRKSEYYLISFFGRVNYTINNKYLFTATIRDDGSSRFSKDNRWGLFPSAAFAWKINEENFLKTVPALSDLKVRLSYGKTGQQDIGGNYDWQPTYTFSQPNADYQLGDKFYTTIRPDGYDSDLKWETTSTYNIGVDYGFLNGRIYGSIDGYIRKTDDLLNKVAVPIGSNLTNMVTTNIGSMDNKGIEFNINAVPIQKKDLTWDVNFNLTWNKTKITKLTLVDNGDYGVPVGSISGGISSTAQIHTVGYAPYTFYLQQQIYDDHGNPIEGEYENNGEFMKSKKPAPDVFFGLSSKVNYKNWTFGFNSHANLGNYVFNNIRSNQQIVNIYNGNTYGNILRFTRDHGFQNNQRWSDYFLYNASFFKLDNISVGYNFHTLGKSAVSMRVTASVENVFTITGYEGLDPEIESGIDRNLYSRPRTFMVGFNFNF